MNFVLLNFVYLEMARTGTYYTSQSLGLVALINIHLRVFVMTYKTASTLLKRQ